MSINNTQQQLIKGVMTHGPDILDYCQTSDDISLYLNRLVEEHLNYPTPNTPLDTKKWFMPEEYRSYDIVDWLYCECRTQEQKDRVTQELKLFAQHDMIDLLKWCKYFVDTCRKNHIVWGVGRGSSVASYVLHIIGVHKIDSIKYDISITEFFKGE
jgi:DNA polymerase III alpha subunit